MKANFQRCMPIALSYEGGYSNHPRDPGGPTLEGITQRVYDGYRARKGKPLRALTAAMRKTPEWIAERDDIYRTQYWTAVRGDELPPGVDLVLFDGAINSGPFQSVKWLQRALGLAQVDGHLGENTLAALKFHPDHDLLIADILARRLGMLRSLSTWDAFGEGWKARVVSVKQIGQAWATGSVGPVPAQAYALLGNARGYASDVAQPAIDAGTATKGAVGAGSVAGVVSQAQAQLEPFVGTSDFVAKVYLTLTVAGLTLAIGGAAYAIYADWRTKRAQRAIDGEVLAEIPEGLPA